MWISKDEFRRYVRAAFQRGLELGSSYQFRASRSPEEPEAEDQSPLTADGHTQEGVTFREQISEIERRKGVEFW